MVFAVPPEEITPSMPPLEMTVLFAVPPEETVAEPSTVTVSSQAAPE